MEEWTLAGWALEISDISKKLALHLPEYISFGTLPPSYDAMPEKQWNQATRPGDMLGFAGSVSSGSNLFSLLLVPRVI